MPEGRRAPSGIPIFPLTPGWPMRGCGAFEVEPPNGRLTSPSARCRDPCGPGGGDRVSGVHGPRHGVRQIYAKRSVTSGERGAGSGGGRAKAVWGESGSSAAVARGTPEQRGGFCGGWPGNGGRGSAESDTAQGTLLGAAAVRDREACRRRRSGRARSGGARGAELFQRTALSAASDLCRR